MKIALKDIEGITFKKWKTIKDGDVEESAISHEEEMRRRYWNEAIDLIGERQISVELCEACDKGRLKIWDAINTWFEDCQHCKGHGLIIRAVNQ